MDISGEIAAYIENKVKGYRKDNPEKRELAEAYTLGWMEGTIRTAIHKIAHDHGIEYAKEVFDRCFF